MERKISSILGIITGACAMYALSAGLRCIYGILLNIIAEGTGIAYVSVSFSIAVGQLIYGISQPLFGILALKKSNRFVLVLGNFLMALGLGGIPFCEDVTLLVVCLGLLFPIGAAASSFGLIVGAITPKLGEKNAIIASGFVNASSGLGNIVLSPLIQRISALAGIKVTMLGLAGFALILVPVGILISERPSKGNGVDSKGNVGLLLKEAFKNKDFVYLLISFFPCGFHIAMTETHLYSQILSYGIEDSIVASIFSFYGVATLTGSLICGFVCTKIRLKSVVTFLYGSRIVWVIGFFLLPKNVYTITLFVILLGLTGASILSPLTGLIGNIFGTEAISTLFGVVFLSHQIGGFLGSWAGGKCVDMYGDYSVAWLISAGLTLIATVISYRIKK